MHWLRTFIVGLVVIFGVGVGATTAAPVAVTASLPYVWIRVAPSSNAPALYTVYPTFAATLETTGNTQWDRIQTWAEVYVIANPSIRGWVEQGSLVGAVQSVSMVSHLTEDIPIQLRSEQNWSTSIQAFASPGMMNSDRIWDHGIRHP